MPSLFHSLPRELVDFCIDKLQEDRNEESKAALRACSLVCRAFYHRARVHLFKQIVFSGLLPADLLSRLSSLLEVMKSPCGIGIGVAPFIRTFEIIIDSTAENAVVEYSTLLIDHENVLCKIMNALHGPDYGIRKFSLAMSSSPPTSTGTIGWADLNTSFKESLYSLLQSPYLTFLHIGNIYDLPSTFLRDTKLEHLHLSHTNFSSLNDFPGEAGRGVPTPPALGCVTMNPADCLTGIAGGYLSHLQHLTTFTSTIFSSAHMDITWEAMKASASSIEAIQLDFYETFPPPPNAFDFGLMTKLRNLALTHTILMPDEEVEITTARTFDEDVQHIYSLLNTPTPAPALRRVDIMITSWQIFPDDDFFTGLHESSRWHLIDSLLTSPKFPALFEVDIFLSLPTVVEQASNFDQKAFKAKVLEYFKQVLPRLTASKTASIGLDVQVILFGRGDDHVLMDDEFEGEDGVFTTLLT
ncbi:hypothetical protein BDN70DRAFT_929538 [Pholiota conissans]|uniref:Uncharacterized protein n=1 Tax=Pholiota conissans TaxID=109636 RepID=A0A9P6CXK5_9AGAR|nr:hypothetical protein BDN70DRAFT_929538 [Pholiota conissans]